MLIRKEQTTVKCEQNVTGHMAGAAFPGGHTGTAQNNKTGDSPLVFATCVLPAWLRANGVSGRGFIFFFFFASPAPT